jgi:two-component system CheB/CheR fusion protein
MDALLQKKLLSVFHYALNAKGFLVLGQAETVGAQATLFSLEDKKYRIHRKRPSAGPATMSFPVDSGAVSAAVRKPSPELPNVERLLQAEVSRVINDRFAPPGVVVDSDCAVQRANGSVPGARARSGELELDEDGERGTPPRASLRRRGGP